jgi:L-threonylcarbamoyladenylate synthase
VSEASARLRGGALAILPTDTVYGIAAAAAVRPACERLYALKARPAEQPVALIAGSVENLLSNVLPEARGRAGVILRALLPGPLTLIVPNPGRRFAYLCGERPDAIGVRVPALPDDVAELADALGGLAMTSANLRGDPAPATLGEVPRELADACAVVVDGGRLSGTASAVIDVTGREPAVVRRSPDAEAALDRIAALR